MIVSVSWRNVWRNRLRSSVILIAVAIGIFAGVFTWSFYLGMVEQRIDTVISTEVSNIQVHPLGYFEDPEIKNYITNADQLVSGLHKDPLIKGATSRIQLNAMALSAEQSTGVMVMGVDPDKEKAVTNIHEKIVEGSYFEGSSRNPIVIGKKLANRLKLKERSKVVLTLQQMDGTITRAQFRVAGIYNISNAMFERMNVFVRSDDLQSLIGMEPGAAHEIAIRTIDNDQAGLVLSQIQSQFTAFDVKGWREILPEVSIIEESMDVSMMVFMVVILFGLCLAIINTMLMAVLERVKEIGMLMAIGMNRKRVFGMVLMETVFLTFSGTVIGIVVASGVSLLFGQLGIDLSMGAEAYESMGFEPIIYPILHVKMIVQITIMVAIASMLSSIPPAIKALQLKPAEAIRSDM
jgi:putative ABC transport system permease protein